MNNIYYIAVNTFRECIRDKIFYSLLVFAIIMLSFSLVLSNLTIGDEIKIIKDFGLSSIQLFGTLIAIFVGINLVYKEMEKRTIYVILANPISRSQFLIGKYLGLSSTLIVEILIMSAGLLLLCYLKNNSFPINLFKAIIPIWVEIQVTLAVALLLSTATSPFISGLLSSCIFVIGHLTNDLKLLVATTNSENLKQICDIIYYTMPNFELLNFKPHVVHYISVPTINWVYAICYGISYSVLLLFLAAFIFNRRDIK